jgi:hypothetical protein
MKRDRVIRSIRVGLLMATAALLANCNQTTGGNAPPPLAAAPSGTVTAAPLGATPSINMAGRWVLGTPAGGSCSMNFGPWVAGKGGSIAPEGGCPGDFFTSRHWIVDNGEVVIRNHRSKPLARLAQITPDQFTGQSATNKQPVTLSRSGSAAPAAPPGR